MKKTIVLGAFILVATIVSAAELELKLGADLYRDATKDATGHNPVKIYPGASLGAEVLFNEESPFRFGIGAEAKSKIHGSDGYDGHYSFPVYAVGKYDFADTLYAVGRLGYAEAHSGGADNVDDANGGIYGALGIGKEFYDERFNVEFMYEVAEYDYDTDFDTNEEGYSHGFAIKFGYKFGGPSPAPVVMAEPEPEPVIVEPEPVVIVPIGPPIPLEGIKFQEVFELNSFELSDSGEAEIQEVADKLKGFEGALSVEGHTDSTGTPEYNQTLSEKRAEAVADVFRTQLEGENITIESKGFGQSKPRFPNDTIENRKANRRVKVFWEPAKEME